MVYSTWTTTPWHDIQVAKQPLSNISEIESILFSRTDWLVLNLFRWQTLKLFRVHWSTSLITPASATQIASLAIHWQKATGCTIAPWPYVLTAIAASGFIAKGMCWIFCQSSGRTLLEEPNKKRMERINMNLHEFHRYSENWQFHLPGFWRYCPTAIGNALAKDGILQWPTLPPIWSSWPLAAGRDMHCPNSLRTGAASTSL